MVFSSLKVLTETLAFKDEADLRKYIPKPKKRFLPSILRISSLDRLILFLIKNGLSEMIEFIQCTVVVVFLILYIISEYEQHFSIYCVDLAVSTLYLVFMGISFLLSERKSHFFCSPHVILDVLTVFPVGVLMVVDIVRIFVHVGSGGDMDGYLFLNSLPYVRLIRLFRMGAVIHTYYQSRERGVMATIYVLLSSMFTLIVAFSAIIILIENETFPVTPLTDTQGFAYKEPLQFHDAAYLVLITILTIGYGDKVPHSILGQFAICAFSVLGALILLGKGKEILAILQNEGESLFENIDTQDVSKHIIVCGHSSAIEIFEFWKEFLNESHGKVATKKIAVVIEDRKEYDKLRRIARHKFFKERVTLVCDDITEFSVLSKVRAEHSHGVFVLTDSKSSNPEMQDSKTLMTVLAIKNFHSKIDVYAQYILEENSRAFTDAGTKIALCINDLKLKLMSNALLVPGLTTLISNVLVSSSADEVIKAFQAQAKSSEDDNWIPEYCEGCENEIYVVNFSKGFVGVPFHKAAEFVYEHYDLVLIAVHNDTGLLLNPYKGSGPYYIQETDRAVVMAQSVFHGHVLTLCNVPDAVRSIHKGSTSISSSVQGDDEYSTFSKKQKREQPIQVTVQSPNDSLAVQPQQTLRKRSLIVPTSPSPSSVSNAPLFNEPATNDSSTSPKSKVPWMKQMDKMKRLRGAVSRVVEVNNTTRYLLSGLAKHSIYSAYLRNGPISREQFFLKSAKHFSDHIIILTTQFQTAVRICTNLRSLYVPTNKMRPLLLMVQPRFANSTEVEKLFQQLGNIKDIHVIYGDFCSHDDLEKAGIKTASSAIFVSNPHETTITEMVDSEAIKTVLSMSSLSPQLSYIAEIVYRRNIKFFRKDNATAPTPKNSILHLIKPQQVDSDFEVYCLTSKLFAAGKIFSRSFFTRLLCQAFFTNEIIEVIENFCGYTRLDSKNSGNRPPTMGVYQISPDPQLIGQEFREVYLHYLRKNGVAIGIYRYKDDKFRYVVSNPPPSTKVLEKDLLFVIGNYVTITRPVEQGELEEKYEYSSSKESEDTTKNDPLDFLRKKKGKGPFAFSSAFDFPRQKQTSTSGSGSHQPGQSPLPQQPQNFEFSMNGETHANLPHTPGSKSPSRKSVSPLELDSMDQYLRGA
eukprot:CAMPEP_0117440516 /NCGR_PEP_ID=MMETSP0759-20121206/3138_1 /TAXON_ID=63605 /ORGANISM="Percolomonas cosmopolitus, Strain WS" /LENGTH=1142 /DNA_ID=CAMNT_0005232299 /DNA_START=298 /DNA_END=3723 /DNA_ORIENTATION=-